MCSGERLVAPLIVWKHQSVFQLICTTKVSNIPLGNLFSCIAFVYAHKTQYQQSPIVYNIVTFISNRFFQL